MQNKYIKLFIIVLAVAIIVPQVVMAAWWNPFSWGVWNRVFHFQRTEQKQEQQQNREQQKNQTVGWKTYTNNEYGFEFKYPATANSFEIDMGFPYTGGLSRSKALLKANAAFQNKYNNIGLSVAQLDSYKFSNTGADITSYDQQKNQCAGGLLGDYEKNNKFLFKGAKGCYIGEADVGAGMVGYLIPNKQQNQIIQIGIGFTSQGGLNSEDALQTLNKIISTFKFISSQPIVGGDKDEHGCIGSAGYSWCEVKQKCLRSWEEKCEAAKFVVRIEEGFIAIRDAAGKLGQTIPISKDGLWITQNNNLADKYVFSYDEDINFDGNDDLRIISSSGYMGVNLFYDYYVFNSKNNSFELFLTGVCNPGFNATKKIINSSCKDGPSYANYIYKYDGKEYIKN